MALNAEQKKELQQLLQSADGFTSEQKSTLLGLLNERKRYGLVWEDKPEDAHEKLRKELPVLKEVPERCIQGASPDSPNHILIEGDNLHALTALQYTHAGKVDVIYIDPPYNTGNKDFRYNDTFKDDFIDREHKFRHSTWLSFISRRLKLAKVLLKETGVIFISIDDNEQAQTKILCDEIFGQNNFVTNVIVQSNKRGQTYKDIAKTHEYIVIYTKNPSTGLNSIEKEESGFSFQDEVGAFSARELRNRNPKFGRYNRPNLFFPIFISSTQFDANGFHLVSIEKSEDYSIETIPLNSEGKESCWRWSKGLLKKVNTSVIGTTPVVAKQKKDGGWNVYEKYRETTARVKSIWDETEVITEQGSTELRMMNLGEEFAFPKPKYLLEKVLQVGANSSALILDFFAGSGTTLHATMALNAEDGGKRQCILVTNNENDICEKVTYERNKRVIQGYTNAKGQAVPGLVNNALRYYQMQFVDRAPSQKNRKALASYMQDLLCLKEGCYTLSAQFRIASCRVFQGEGFLLFIVLSPDAIEEVVAAIAAQAQPCKVFVYSPDADPFSVDFEEVEDRIELYALPDVYYRALRSILPEAMV